MDEFQSRSSITNAISQLVLSQPEVDQFPTLPSELILLIIALLSREDRQKFCLLSKSYRQLALPALFRKVKYSRYVPDYIQKCNEARKDVKAAIKELVLEDGSYRLWDYESILFPFLRSLPNLQSFQWKHFRRRECQGFLGLVASLQHCPLEHFTYRGPLSPEEQVTAPPHLKSLSIEFHHTQMYGLIQPSFSTLVELELCPASVKIDLVPMRPVGSTLRKFVYNVKGFDPDILDTIPDVFPHLTTLELRVRRDTTQAQDLQWKTSYDDAIAKNTKLQYLAVYAYGFIFCRYEHSYRHVKCKKCGDQRVQIARALAMACSGLKRCRWDHTHAQYCFDVRLSRKSPTSIRIKRVAVTSDVPVM